MAPVGKNKRNVTYVTNNVTYVQIMLYT